MLGLNLNTSIPFSPVTEITYHALTPEEEVDAVTGKEDKMSHDLLALFMLHQENEKKTQQIISLHIGVMIYSVYDFMIILSRFVNKLIQS